MSHITPGITRPRATPLRPSLAHESRADAGRVHAVVRRVLVCLHHPNRTPPKLWSARCLGASLLLPSGRLNTPSHRDSLVTILRKLIDTTFGFKALRIAPTWEAPYKPWPAQWS